MICFVFGQTLSFDFVNYDDPQYVTENALVQSGITWAGIMRVFTHSDYSFYHPLTTLSHMLDIQVYGLNPSGFHLTNVILHAASTLLLFLILHSMTGSVWRSALVAAVFSIHPLRAESVAWITERKDTLSGLFFMLTLASYVRYVRKVAGRKSQVEGGVFWLWWSGSYGLVFLCMAASMLSKATVVTLPFVLLLLDFWPLRRLSPASLGSSYGGQALGRRDIRRIVLEKIPFFLLSAGICLVTVITANESLHSEGNRVLGMRLSNAMVSYVTYLFELVAPVNLAVLYPYPVETIPFWKSGGAVLLLGGITLLIVRNIRKRPFLLTGWLWFLGMLVPMIGIVQAGGQAHADRYTYLSQIGLLIAVSWLLGDWVISRRRRMVASFLVGAVLLGLMLGARVQARYWSDSVSLWIRSLNCTTENFVAHGSLGAALFVEGETDAAIQHFKASLAIESGRSEVWNNLAVAYAELEQWKAAIFAARRALIFAPEQCSPEAIQVIRARVREYEASFQALEEKGMKK